MKTLHGKTILVVDDERELRDLLMEEFALAGALVFGAENGVEALAIVKKRAFDAVLADIRMPGGDGLTLLSDIHVHLKDKPKLFLCSGFDDTSMAVAAELGVVEVFSKPFMIAHVIAVIAGALSKAEPGCQPSTGASGQGS